MISLSETPLRKHADRDDRAHHRRHESAVRYPTGGPLARYCLGMDFSRDELLWINNALSEVLGGPQAIEGWEFHSRIGGDKDVVKALLRRVHDEVSALRRADPEW